MTRDLPKSIEDEKGLLSSMIQDKRVIADVASKAKEEWFYEPKHITLYATIIEMWNNAEPVDIITLSNKLRAKNKLDSVGGEPYVAEVYTFVPGPSNFAYYLENVRDKYISRQVLAVCTRGQMRSYDEEDVTGLVSTITTELSAIASPAQEKRSLKEALMDKLNRMESDEPDKDILKTGIEGLDKYSPLRLGDMPLIVGQRKDGKSILALTIAGNLLTQGKRIEYFSLESPETEVIDRLFAGISRIPMDHHHMSKMGEAHLSKASTAITKMSEWKLRIHDDIYELGSIIATIRQAKAQFPDLSVAVVDYGQLVIASGGKKDRNREQEVASVSRGLRLVAMECKIAVVLLSQLNDDRKARESRSLEMDTTACWELIRDEDEPNERKIAVPYQRNGESGISFDVAFFGNIGRIENMARDAR